MTNKEIAERIERDARTLIERGNTEVSVQLIYNNAKVFRETCDDLTAAANAMGAHDDA